MSFTPVGVRRVVLASALALAVSACGITSTPLEAALGDASSAAGSAVVALRALEEGEVTTAVAGTTVDDAVVQISQASTGAVEYRGSPGAERQLQERAVPVIARTARDLHQAQDHLTTATARARLMRVLARDRDLLERLSTRAGDVG